MELHYLTFDFSDEASGHGSFDALASVLPARLPALLEEIGTVLRWAQGTFGPAGGEDAEWDYDIQAVLEPGTPLDVTWDAVAAQVRIGREAGDRTTVAFTLSGSAVFCDAVRDRFQEAP